MAEHQRRDNGAPHPHERRDDPLLAEILATVREVNRKLAGVQYELGTTREAVERVEARTSGQEKAFAEHLAEGPGKLAEAIEGALNRGFPDADPEGHRAVHEADIQRAKDRAEFWNRMNYEITKYGLMGFIGWAAYVLWAAFLRGPGK